MVGARPGSSFQRVLVLFVAGPMKCRRAAFSSARAFLLVGSRALARGRYCGAIVPPAPACGRCRAEESFLRVSRILPGLPARDSPREAVCGRPSIAPGRYLQTMCAAAVVLGSPPIVQLLSSAHIVATGGPVDARSPSDPFACRVHASLDDGNKATCRLPRRAVGRTLRCRRSARAPLSLAGPSAVPITVGSGAGGQRAVSSGRRLHGDSPILTH
jgi:hypothetical protein